MATQAVSPLSAEKENQTMNKRAGLRAGLIALAMATLTVACGGGGSDALAAGAWDSGQLCEFIDDAEVNAAASRDDLEAVEINWSEGDVGCKWDGPNSSAFNPDIVFWMNQTTVDEPNRFFTENELNLAGADVSWTSEALDGNVPLDASFNAYVGDQRLSIEPGFDYDDDGALSAFALETLTRWVAIQSGNTAP